MNDKVVGHAAEIVADEWREKTLENIRDADQGADGMEDFVTDVEEVGSAAGVAFGFEVDHPTAELHERGGHIEPMYGLAMSQGMERDDFYNALTDCNEWVDEKRLVRDAADRTRRAFR